jgi:hypothetical protein
MKIFLVLFSLILLTFCSRNPPQKIDNSLQPVIEISPVFNQTAESNLSLPDEVVALNNKKIPAFPTFLEVDMEKLLRKENTNRLKKFGLYDLKRQQLATDDLEVRVWLANDLYMRVYKNLAVKESVFILKRTNGNWSAEVSRNTVKGKSNAEKLIKTKLDVPKSDWENVWRNFIKNELLTFPDLVTGRVEYAIDAGSYIIESKVDGIFKTYEKAGTQDTREIQHVRKILSIISEEFDLEDF